jgi:hypothetical protein
MVILWWIRAKAQKPYIDGLLLTDIHILINIWEKRKSFFRENADHDREKP